MILFSSAYGYTFLSFLLLIIVGSLTVNLIRQPRRMPGGHWLITMLITVCLSLLSMFLLDAIPLWGGLFQPLPDGFVTLGMVALVRFSYTFPEEDQRLEGRFMVLVSGLLALVAILMSARFMIAFASNGGAVPMPGLGYRLITPVAVTLSAVMNLRRSLHLTRSAQGPLLQRLLNPESSVAIFHRNLALVQLSILFLLASGLMLTMNLLSVADFALAVSLGLPASLMVVYLIYRNATEEMATEFNTLRFRLFGISLIVLLFLLGVIGLSRLRQSEQRYLEERAALAQVVAASFQESGTIQLPEPIDYLIRWEQMPGSATEELRPTLLASQQPAQSILEAQREFHLREPTPRWMQMNLAQGAIDLPYAFQPAWDGWIEPIPGGWLEVGFDRAERHFVTQALNLRLLAEAVAGVILISIMFTLIIRPAVSKPLDNLLAGVEAANQGDLTVRLPVLHWDEIGFLTDSFNKMIQSIQESHSALQASNESLERQVAARTADLRTALEQAESANRAKSAFLANMNHELRTPLTVVLGYAELLSQSSLLDGNEKAHLTAIQRSGEHLLGLINNVLDFSKIEAGFVAIDENRVDLFRLLQDLQEMFQPKIREKDLAFQTELAPGLPRHVCTDDARLRQVLVNLLGNGLKFTEQGEIRLRVGWQPLEQRTENRDSEVVQSIRLTFAVVDTGPGLTLTEIDGIFDAFVQGQAGIRSGAGTGLGLPISRHLVQMLGGDLTVESEKGVGSAFAFDIQTTTVAAASLPQDIQPVAPASGVMPTGVRMLIVDDLPANRGLLRHILTLWGFDVLEAENGEVAVQRWQSWQPHIIWMDMRMPVMDGRTACAKIRSSHAAPQPVIFALTASILESEKDALLADGFDALIWKPYRQDDIRQAILQHVEDVSLQPVGRNPSTQPERSDSDPIRNGTVDSSPAATLPDFAASANRLLEWSSDHLQLLQSGELQPFVQALDHDLRNPLSAILGTSEILETDYDLLGEDDRLMLLREIQSSGDRILDILSSLRNLPVG